MEQRAGITIAKPAPSFARFPAVPAAVCFLLGVGTYARFPAWTFLWIGLLAVTICCAIRIRRRHFLAAVILCLGWAITGVLAAQLAAYAYPVDHIGLYAADEPRLAQLELSLDEPPHILSNPFDRRHAAPPKQVALASVTRARTNAGWIEASGDVLLQVSEPSPSLAAGQIIRAVGYVQRPAPAQNPGQFDSASYYRDRRVLASFSVGHAVNLHIISNDGPGWLTAARIRVRRLLAEGFTADQALDHALLNALLLGDNDPQLRDVQEEFQHTGTAHHLAISGTHIAILGGILWGIFRLIGLRPRFAAAIVLTFVIGYGALALPTPSVMRSVVLAVAFCLAAILGRTGQALQLLALSIMAMLIYHPPDLFNAGFQLSFGTVLGLILFSKPTLAAMETYRPSNHPDEVVRRSFETPSVVRLLWERCCRHFLEALAVGMVAWFISMPLIAYHFEQLNPYGVLAGILMAPVVLIALFGGMVKVLFTLLWPGQASLWAAMAVYPVMWMRHFVGWLASWPYADIPVPPPPWWLITLFYSLFLLGLFPRMPSGPRWALRIARAATAAFIVLPFVQAKISPALPNGTVRITLLSVGAGQCAVVQPPGGRMVVLDAGSSTLGDPVDKCIAPFLRQVRCTNIDTIVLSHADFDHVGATVDLVKKYGVREVLTGPRFLDHEGPQAQELVADLGRLERPPRIVMPGQRDPLGRDTVIEVLWPPPPADGIQPAKASSNDGCLVFRLTHAGKAILFPGDIQDGAMRELLKAPDKLKADVLVAMHHGSAEPLSKAFIAAVNPQYIISSNDRALSGKQRTFNNLAKGRQLLRTSDCGAITVSIDGKGNLVVEPFLKQ